MAAKEGADTMAVARTEDGRRMLVHLGGEGDYTADLNVKDASGAARATLIGEIGAADFIQSAVAFALRFTRRRASRDSEASS
jgi:hypothetical protein